MKAKRTYRYLLTLLCCVFATSMEAKRWVHVQFQPSFENKQLYLNTRYRTSLGDSIQLNTFRWYISNLQFIRQDQVVFNYPKQAILMDLSDRSSLHFVFAIEDTVQFDKLQFGLGVDSVTNDAGIHGGDLDPTKGMYWAWQSGYINTMIKGQFTLSSKPLKEFEFHLGGFMAPFNAYQRVSLPACSHDKLTIQWDLDSWFSSPVFIQHDRIMSPRIEAVQMSEFLASQFSCR